MPTELTFDKLPVGYTISTARKEEPVLVSTVGFLSSEDGDKFVTFLEGFPSTVLSMAGIPHVASRVDHLLAIVRPDKTATLYVNELQLISRIRTKRSLRKGEVVFTNDIADIDRLQLGDVDVPHDAGVVFVFSVGWRKGLFYDLTPLEPKTRSPREYGVEVRLGQLYRYLQFQHVYKITQDEWKLLVRAGWFPFVTLDVELVQEIIGHVRNGWDVDDLLPKAAAHVHELIPRLRERWQRNPFFSPHFEILASGLERYLAEDYVSAVAILVPKMEGILRTFSFAKGSQSDDSGKLTDMAVRKLQEENPDSLLFPRRFRKYLNAVYFRPFDPSRPEGMTRHTLAHGVAPTESFSLKSATLSILALDQLVFFLGNQSDVGRDANGAR